MKTKFNTLVEQILSSLISGKTATTKQITAARKEAASMCLMDLKKLREARLARETEEKKRNLVKNAQEPPASAKRFNVKKTFNIADAPENLDVIIVGSNPEHPNVPQANHDYVFRKSHVSDLLTWLTMKGGELSLYLCGPTGCGKSSIIIEAAARVGIPVWNVVAHSRLETPELVGGYRLTETGGMKWVDGPLVSAMKEGGWFLLDELDLLDPATAAGLNGVAEGRPLTIPETGEVVSPAEGFRFIATANSNGAGDSTGMYQGILRQNMAFLDRFYMVELGYPDEEIEKTILTKITPNLALEIRDRMVKIANEVRELFVKGEVEVTFSTRTLTRWARVAAFQGKAAAQGGKAPSDILKHTFDRALGFRAEPESRKSLHEILQRHFG